MNKMLNILKFSALFAAFLTLSCATRLHEPQNSFNLDDSHSIIFGKFEPYINGVLVTNRYHPSPGGPTIMCHVGSYDSEAALKTNLWKFPSYFFVTDLNKDGYFNFSIPPGKYYIGGYDYIYFFAAYPVLSVTALPSKYYTNSISLMTFNVPPNRAVYIGTIRQDFNMEENNFFFLEGNLKINYRNDFVNAEKWFLGSNLRFEGKVVDGPINAVNVTPAHKPQKKALKNR